MGGSHVHAASRLGERTRLDFADVRDVTARRSCKSRWPSWFCSHGRPRGMRTLPSLEKVRGAAIFGHAVSRLQGGERVVAVPALEPGLPRFLPRLHVPEERHECLLQSLENASQHLAVDPFVLRKCAPSVHPADSPGRGSSGSRLPCGTPRYVLPGPRCTGCGTAAVARTVRLPASLWGNMAFHHRAADDARRGHEVAPGPEGGQGVEVRERLPKKPGRVTLQRVHDEHDGASASTALRAAGFCTQPLKGSVFQPDPFL